MVTIITIQGDRQEIKKKVLVAHSLQEHLLVQQVGPTMQQLRMFKVYNLKNTEVKKK